MAHMAAQFRSNERYGPKSAWTEGIKSGFGKYDPKTYADLSPNAITKESEHKATTADYALNSPHNPRNTDDMNPYVGRIRVVGTVKSELLS